MLGTPVVCVAAAVLALSSAASPTHPVVPNSYSASINTTIFTVQQQVWNLFDGYFAPEKFLKENVIPPPSQYNPQFALSINDATTGCTALDYSDTQCAVDCYQGTVRLPLRCCVVCGCRVCVSHRVCLCSPSVWLAAVHPLPSTP